MSWIFVWRYPRRNFRTLFYRWHNLITETNVFLLHIKGFLPNHQGIAWKIYEWDSSQTKLRCCKDRSKNNGGFNMCLLCGKYRKILPILSIIGNIIALSKKSNFVQSDVLAWLLLQSKFIYHTLSSCGDAWRHDLRFSNNYNVIF